MVEIDDETKEMPIDNLRYAHSVQKRRILSLSERIDVLEKENTELKHQIEVWEAKQKQWEKFRITQQNIVQNALTASNLQNNVQMEQIDKLYKERIELEKQVRELKGE